MQQPIRPAPSSLTAIAETSDPLPSPAELGLQHDKYSNMQKGGRSEGLKLLHSFLNQRGEGYTKEMSSPVTAFDGCARISAQFSFWHFIHP